MTSFAWVLPPCVLSWKPHKLRRRNSFAIPPNTASLSNSDASGTLAGKFLTKSCNALMKPLEIGPEACSNVEFHNAALISFNILVKANYFLVLWGDVESVASQSSREFSESRLIEQISGCEGQEILVKQTRREEKTWSGDGRLFPV